MIRLLFTLLFLAGCTTVVLPTTPIVPAVLPVAQDKVVQEVILGAGADVLFDDTFTDTDGVLLDAHTPDTGTSWTQVYQNGGSGCSNDPDLQISGTGTLESDCDDISTAGSGYQADTTYTSADYQVQYDCTDCGTIDEYVWPMIRATATFAEENGGYVLYDTGPGTIDDPKISIVTGSGSCTELDRIDQGEIAQGYYQDGVTSIFQAQGDEIIAFVDNVGILYDVESTITAAGKGGIGMGALPCETTADLSLTDQEIDNFSIVEIAENNTGWLDPTTTGEISDSWTDPANAYASNDTDATETTPGELQDYGDFGASIPAGSTITGVQVRIEGVGGSARWRAVCAEVSIDNGSTWASNLCGRIFGDKASSATDDFMVFGHANYLWGLTWLDGDTDDTDFRIRLEMDAEENTGGELELDHVSVKIFYDSALITATPNFTVKPSGLPTIKPGSGVTIKP